jgi:hypothetical protein
MSLSEWRKNGWLKSHQTSPQEIADLLAVADRDLKDCQTKGLSDDWKFNIAYNAALQASSAALAASGYAVAKGDSNHFRVVQSLAFTIGADAAAIQRFDGFRKKRSMSVYDAAGVITSAEAGQIIRFSEDLVGQIKLWLRTNHLTLLK